MNDIKFYDTSALLADFEAILSQEEHFVLSSITFKELERIKTSSNKDLDVKYAARLLLELLDRYPEKYDVVIHKNIHELPLATQNLDVTDDTRILMDAYWYNNNVRIDETIFVTNDLSLKHIANLFFGNDMIESVVEDSDDYTGYKEINIHDDNLGAFYQDNSINHYNLYIGQYLIIKEDDGNIADVRVWTGKDHRYLAYHDFDSMWFGKVFPYKGDIYQKLLFDSLCNNKITMVKGPAGSGKSLVSLACLMQKLEKNEIDRVVVFCNTVATANSAKLGFLPGDRDTKLLDSQIGNLLSSKFGGRDAIVQLMEREQLVLMPLSDCRGYDTSGMRAGVYISEAQNMDRALMKLALQRIGEDSICIIDGDYNQQVDMPVFAGANNGMRRASKIFRGSEIYGEVELCNVHRSRIAQIAENM